MTEIRNSSENKHIPEDVFRKLILVASALLFALPFNFGNTFVLSWISLSVLFCEVFDCRITKKRVLSSLFCFFFLFYFCVYFWFTSLYPLDFAGLSDFQSTGVVAIALVFIPLVHAIVMIIPILTAVLSVRKLKSDLLKALAVSFAYTAGEFLQSLGTFAFPWARLFVGQMKSICVLQSASLFGSYFITFLIVFVNALVAFGIISLKNNKRKSICFFVMALVVFFANFTFGALKILSFDKNEFSYINAVSLQGNIPSGEKWDGSVSNTDVYLELLGEAKNELEEKGFDADVVLLPETAIPITLGNDSRKLSSYAKKTDALLKGAAEDFESDILVGAFSSKDGRSANSVFVYKQNGDVSEPYSKNNLVPFGEFLPYRSVVETLFPALGKINMLSSDLVKGERGIPLETSFGKAASLICFDSIFPENARLQVKNGAEIVTVSTNDSWYKTSRALYQHADHSVMRAIENGRSLVRSANTGISLICDPVGRVKTKTNVNERGYVYASVPKNRNITLYTRIGDVIAYLSVVVVAVLLLVCIIKKHLPKPRGVETCDKSEKKI